MNKDIKNYNSSQTAQDKKICDLLATIIDKNSHFTESKIWHAHPVWFINGNPIVGYSKLKAGVRMLFWSGASFDEDSLKPGSGKFKDASITYQSVEEINQEKIINWLKKAEKIQWDYKNIVKNKGKLERIV